MPCAPGIHRLPRFWSAVLMAGEASPAQCETAIASSPMLPARKAAAAGPAGLRSVVSVVPVVPVVSAIWVEVGVSAAMVVTPCLARLVVACTACTAWLYCLGGAQLGD